MGGGRRRDRVLRERERERERAHWERGSMQERGSE